MLQIFTIYSIYVICKQIVIISSWKNIRRCNVTRVLVGNPREIDHLGDQGVDRRIILRWIFGKWDVSLWTGSSRLRIGTGGRHL
jgi:hypothetical protein